MKPSTYIVLGEIMNFFYFFWGTSKYPSCWCEEQLLGAIIEAKSQKPTNPNFLSLVG